MSNSVGLDTPNSKYYALHNTYNIKCELRKLQLTQYNQHTTNGELSITEHSHMQTRHSFWFTIWQTGAIVDTVTH